MNPFGFGSVPAVPWANTNILLHFEGTNGSTYIPESSRYAHVISKSGNASLSTAQSKIGSSSLYLDGTGDYIQVSHHAAGAVSAVTGDFGIELWVRPTSTAACNLLIKAVGTGHRNYGLSINAGGKFTAEYSSVVPAITTLTGTTSVAINTWYHLALVRYGTTFTLYVNGVAEATGTLSGSLYDIYTAPVTIGATSTGTNPFTGYIDAIRFVKGMAPYVSGFTPVLTQYSDRLNAGAYSTAVMALSPFGYWKLDDASGSSVAADSSGSARNGTYTGTFTKPVGGQVLSDYNNSAALGNGVNAYVTIPNSPAIYGFVGWTWGAVFKVRNLGTGNYCPWHVGDAAVGGQQGIYLVTSSNGSLTFSHLSGSLSAATGASYLSEDIPCHLVWRFDTTTGLSLFKNGVKTSLTWTGAISAAPARPLLWGACKSGSHTFFMSGPMDDCFAFNSLLSDTQITDLAAAAGFY